MPLALTHLLLEMRKHHLAAHPDCAECREQWRRLIALAIPPGNDKTPSPPAGEEGVFIKANDVVDQGYPVDD